MPQTTQFTHGRTAPNDRLPADLATDAVVCVAHGCEVTDGLRPVHHPDRDTRVLCEYHAKDYLEVSS